MKIKDLIDEVITSKWIRDVSEFKKIFPEASLDNALIDFEDSIPDFLRFVFRNNSMENVVLEFKDSLVDSGLAEVLCTCTMYIDGVSPYTESFTLSVVNSVNCYYYFVLEDSPNSSIGNFEIAKHSFSAIEVSSHREVVEDFNKACESYYDSVMTSSVYDEYLDQFSENHSIQFDESIDGIEFKEGFYSRQAF